MIRILREAVGTFGSRAFYRHRLASTRFSRFLFSIFLVNEGSRSSGYLLRDGGRLNVVRDGRE